MGRTKRFEEQLRLPLSTEMLKEIDASLGEGEERVAMIRDAIAAEIKRRKRRPKLTGSEGGE